MKKDKLSKLIESSVNNGVPFDQIAETIIKRFKVKPTPVKSEKVVTMKEHLKNMIEKCPTLEVSEDRFNDGSSSWLEIKRVGEIFKEGEPTTFINICFEDDDITLQDIEMWQENMTLDPDSQKKLF